MEVETNLSVNFSCVTLYCIGVSFFFNSALSTSISGLGGPWRRRLSLAVTLAELEAEGVVRAETGFSVTLTRGLLAGTTATCADMVYKLQCKLGNTK